MYNAYILVHTYIDDAVLLFTCTCMWEWKRERECHSQPQAILCKNQSNWTRLRSDSTVLEHVGSIHIIWYDICAWKVWRKFFACRHSEERSLGPGQRWIAMPSGHSLLLCVPWPHIVQCARTFAYMLFRFSLLFFPTNCSVTFKSTESKRGNAHDTMFSVAYHIFGYLRIPFVAHARFRAEYG